MAKNTALQELIKILQDNKNALQGNIGLSAGLANAIAVAKLLLPKERQDIEQAHDKGISRYCQWEPDRHGNKAPTGSDYFTKTFTQNK